MATEQGLELKNWTQRLNFWRLEPEEKNNMEICKTCEPQNIVALET